jgi:NADPH2:quinone reductase
MKAIRVRRFGPPEVLRLEDVPDLQPSGDQILVRLAAVGVNPVETYLRSGDYANRPALPFTPGSDGAGTIAGGGGREPHLRLGSRVYLSGAVTGTYAELALCTPEQVHPLPERATYAQGAALGVPYATAYRALFQRGRALPGETVLVNGASGGVGIAVTQFAAAAGLTVMGPAGSKEGRRLAAAQGAAHVFDHGDPTYGDAIMTLTNGRGVDLIIEMAAHHNLGRDPALLAQGGRIVVVGSRGPQELNARDLMMRDAQVLGMLLMVAPPAALMRAHAAIVAGLRQGSLSPVIEKELPLAEAAEAHRLIADHRAHGKIVLVP